MHDPSRTSGAPSRADTHLRRIYFVLGVAIVSMGAVHVASTARLFPGVTNGAVWFAGGGLAIVLTGVLNLLRRAYGEHALGLRHACIAANVVMTGYALLGAYASHAPALQAAAVVGLFGAVTVLSAMTPAQQPGRHAAGAPREDTRGAH